MKVFGFRIKTKLKEIGTSQKELARLLNVQPSTLCEWLNDHNEPPMQAIVDIARILDVSCDYLLGVSEEE